METNQGKMARPPKAPILRFNKRAKDSGFFSENQKSACVVRNVITEEPSSQILPPKQEEVFGSPAKCYIIFDAVIRLRYDMVD